MQNISTMANALDPQGDLSSLITALTAHASLVCILHVTDQAQPHVVVIVLVTKSHPTLLQFHGLWPTRLLCLCDFPGKNTEWGCHFLLSDVLLSDPSGSSWPRDWTHISCIGGRFFTTKPPKKPKTAILYYVFKLQTSMKALVLYLLILIFSHLVWVTSYAK